MLDNQWLEKMLNLHRKGSMALVHAQGERLRAEELKKIGKHDLMLKAEKNGAKSIAQQERDAYASPEYLELVNEVIAATEHEQELRYSLQRIEWEIELKRTLEASRRAEVRAYG